MPDTLNVGTVCDWARGARCNAWGQLLDDINNAGALASKILHKSYPLADLILATPSSKESGFFVKDLDVLIVNWDAANGDPEFGSHLSVSWLEHRRPEILLWLRAGRLLIIESQAVLSVPSQKAYDALVGAGELKVCGPEDALNPLKQIERMSGQCQRTKRTPMERGFENVSKLENRAVVGPTHDSLFPGHAANFLTAHINDTPWNKILYRGWFRRRLFLGANLPWVSIFKTGDRPRLKNHSTMQVAKVGDGAIFATTMFLATTRQRDLVVAILSCAKGAVKHLPDPPSFARTLRKHGKTILTLPAGMVAGYIVAHYSPAVQWLVDALAPFIPGLDQEALGSALKTGLVLAGILVFLAAKRLFEALKRFVADFVGY